MPTSSYVELKKARKPSNPPPIGLDWKICDRDGVGILKYSPISCSDVAHVIGHVLRASKRAGETTKKGTRYERSNEGATTCGPKEAGSAPRRPPQRLIGLCVNGTFATFTIYAFASLLQYHH